MDEPFAVQSRALLRHRRVQLFLLAIAMAAAGYARTALSPVQEALRVALSLSDNKMALLQGPIIGIPVALVAVPLGLLIDRYSRSRLLIVLIAVSLAGSVLTALASSFPMLLVARGVTGLTALSVIPIVFSLLSDLCTTSQRGRATTVVIVGQVIGNSVVFTLGGGLLEMAGGAPQAWREVMGWLCAPFAVAAIALLALREPRRMGVRVDHPSLRQVWGELRQYQAVIGCLSVGVVLLETAVGAMLAWAGPMLARTFQLHPDRVGTTMGLAMLISGLVGPAIGGTLADVCQRVGGPSRTVGVLGALALLSAPAGMFAFASDVTYASVLLVLAMTLMLGGAVMGITLFTVVIPNELRGICISVLMAADMLFSFAIAPPLVSMLSFEMGGTVMIGHALSAVCLAASAFAAIAFIAAKKFLNAGNGVVMTVGGGFTGE